MLLHIEFYEFKNIIKYWFTNSAKPKFNIISCYNRQVLYKPWRVVELTAYAGAYTVLSFPDDVIRIELYLDESTQSVSHSHGSNHFQHKQGYDHNYVICHKGIYEKDGQCYLLLLLQQQMSKYANTFQQLHESDLHQLHSSYQFHEYSDKSTSCSNGYPLILPHTRMYDKPPTLNVVEGTPSLSCVRSSTYRDLQVG